MGNTPSRDPKGGLSGVLLLGVVAVLGVLVIALARSIIPPVSTASSTAAQEMTTVPITAPDDPFATSPDDPSFTPAAIPPSSPVPTPQLSDPFNVHGWGLVGTWKPEELTKEAPLVVVGTVTKVYPARWTTLDGARPENPHSSDNTHTIYTPVEVTVTEFLKGSHDAAQLMLGAIGGVVGQDSVTSDPPETVFKEGEQVMLFLAPDRRKLSFQDIPLLEVSSRYTITADGKLLEYPEDLSLDEAIQAVESVEQ